MVFTCLLLLDLFFVLCNVSYEAICWARDTCALFEENRKKNSTDDAILLDDESLVSL